MKGGSGNLLHALTIVGVNAVPAAGWFLDRWSAGTTLTVYWFENVAICVFIGARIALHRRLNPRRGHYRYAAPAATGRTSSNASFLQGFLVTGLAFCAAHGIFLAVIVLLLNDKLTTISWRSVGIGCAIVLVLLIAEFCADLPRLHRWPFLRIEQMANLGLGRVIVVHLTLIVGLIGVALTGASSALFGVFVVLKTLYALSTGLPQYEPAAPPGWLRGVMDRVPNIHPGKTFDEFWAKDRADETARRARNEEPYTC